MAQTATVTLTTAERINRAIAMTVESYAEELNNDPSLRAVRVEVRVKPDGMVRAVILQRESELAP